MIGGGQPVTGKFIQSRLPSPGPPAAQPLQTDSQTTQATGYAAHSRLGGLFSSALGDPTTPRPTQSSRRPQPPPDVLAIHDNRGQIADTMHTLFSDLANPEPDPSRANLNSQFSKIQPVSIGPNDSAASKRMKSDYNSGLALVQNAQPGKYEKDGKQYNVFIDKNGRKIVQVTAGGQTTTYALDQNGNLATQSPNQNGSISTNYFQPGANGNLTEYEMNTKLQAGETGANQDNSYINAEVAEPDGSAWMVRASAIEGSSGGSGGAYVMER